MKKTNPATYLVLSIVVFLAVAGGYWYVFSSVDAQITSTTSVLQEIAAEQYRQDHQRTISDSLKKVADNKDRLEKYFVSSEQVVGFIEKVEGIGGIAGANLTLSSINADDITTAATGTIGKIKAHVSGTGSWAAVMKSVSIAERLPYSVSLNNLRLDLAGLSETTGKALSQAQWRVDFDIEVLSIK
mgnify:CR=1 FL=1